VKNILLRKFPGFTILEILVVIGIIALLAALLMPALSGARKQAGLLKCQTNLSALYKGFLIFSTDHNDYLPGNYYTRNESEYWKTDWLSGQGALPDTGVNPDPPTISAAFQATPEHGTLFPYIGKQPLVLRCPNIPQGPFGQGKGSNGKFDYSVIGIFAGAKIDKIEGLSQFKNPQMNRYQSHATPLLLEEDPENHINNKYVEGCHGHIDKFSRIHSEGSPYVSVDGSVHSFSPPPDATFWNWQLLTPSGVWWTQFTDFQNKKYGLVWGEWNRK
jgi:prepilin-type N-terminal cleavage/methylation domain-containing protein